MKTQNMSEILSKIDAIYSELCSLNSLIEVISSYCYNNNLNNDNIKFSNERNNYLNLLKIANYKVNSLHELNDDIESKLLKLK